MYAKRNLGQFLTYCVGEVVLGRERRYYEVSVLLQLCQDRTHMMVSPMSSEIMISSWSSLSWDAISTPLLIEKRLLEALQRSSSASEISDREIAACTEPEEMGLGGSTSSVDGTSLGESEDKGTSDGVAASAEPGDKGASDGRTALKSFVDEGTSDRDSMMASELTSGGRGPGS